VTVQPTTTAALSAAFVTAIHAIEPRYPHASAERWKHTPGGRERGGAEGIRGAALRSFDLLWSPGMPTLRCFYGEQHEEYQATMRVAVSYADVPVEHLEHLITADGIDLRRALLRLSEPTVPGLTIAVYDGVAAYEVDDAANAYIEHRFVVTWCQDTDFT
jgi:hypothetical protein